MLHGLSLIVAAAALAVSPAAPVTIDAGRPVRVRTDVRVAIADDRAITATVVDPIYVRDRVVVAAGGTVQGHLETFHAASTRDQVAAMAGGDLTPAIGARIRFETLTPSGGAPMRIAATAIVNVDEPAPTTGEWMKDYLLTQLPFHRRYVHRGAILTMTFVEPLLVAGEPMGSSPAHSEVPVRLLTRLDTATASVGDVVEAQLMAPIHDADGGTTAVEGTIVTGTVTKVARGRAFGRGGHVTVRFDGLSTTMARSDPPIRFIWPPLATLALLGARDPSAPDQSTFWGRAGAGWSGFLVIGAAVAQISEPVAMGFGVWGLVHATWINVLRRGHDVVLPADSIVLLITQ